MRLQPGLGTTAAPLVLRSTFVRSSGPCRARAVNARSIFLISLFSSDLSLTMVVVQPVPSTSKTPRKNRRTLSKKKAPRIADERVDRDDEMKNVPPESGNKPTGHSPDEEVLIDVDGPGVAPATTEAPSFGPAAPASVGQTSRSETRRVAIPPHRMSPLKRDWINIFGPLTELLGLQVRMNVQRKCVEIRVRRPSS
jgi:RNA-binding protein PNO1